MNAPYSTGCSQICNQGRDCDCIVQQCQYAAPEGGNYWVMQDAPIEISARETIELQCFAGLALAIASAIIGIAIGLYFF